jgi:hypothetical protein
MIFLTFSIKKDMSTNKSRICKHEGSLSDYQDNAATAIAEHFAAAVGDRSSCGGNNTSSSLSSQSRRMFLHSRLALTQNVCVIIQY